MRRLHRWTLLTSILLLVIAVSPVNPAFPSAGSSPMMPSPNTVTNWSSLQRFTSTVNVDFSPSVVQALDGTVWVFYTVTPLGINGAPTALPQIRYKTSTTLSATYNASLWSVEQTLVSQSFAQNDSPSATQAGNQTIFLTFSSNRTGYYNIYLKKYMPSQGWQSETQVTWTNTNDKEPSVVAAKDGSVWVFYYRVLSGSQNNIYYKINRNGVWSSETAFTNDPAAQNTDPFAYQMRDGTIWLVWSHYDSTNGQHLFYKVYNPSTGAWSGQTQLTSTTNPDMHPALTMDQNNTIWLAWSRELTCGGLCYQWDIFYRYSTNYGSAWSAEANLTNDAACTANCADDMMSSNAQLKDGRIYLFWASTRDAQNYWDIYYSATAPQPFHNVAVTSLSVGPVLLRLGHIVTINVTVADLGTFPESLSLFITAKNKTSTNIAVQYISLGPGQSMKLTIAWNGSPVPPGEYVISASIPMVNSEIVTGDNTLSAPRIRMVPPGDVNMDGKVDIIDAAIVSIAYGSVVGSPNWNPMADLDGNGKVDIIDAATVAASYGMTG